MQHDLKYLKCELGTMTLRACRGQRSRPEFDGKKVSGDFLQNKKQGSVLYRHAFCLACTDYRKYESGEWDLKDSFDSFSKAVTKNREKAVKEKSQNGDYLKLLAGRIKTIINQCPKGILKADVFQELGLDGNKPSPPRFYQAMNAVEAQGFMPVKGRYYPKGSDKVADMQAVKVLVKKVGDTVSEDGDKSEKKLATSLAGAIATGCCNSRGSGKHRLGKEIIAKPPGLDMDFLREEAKSITDEIVSYSDIELIINSLRDHEEEFKKLKKENKELKKLIIAVKNAIDISQSIMTGL